MAVSCTYSSGRAVWHDAFNDSTLQCHHRCHQCCVCVSEIKRYWGAAVRGSCWLCKSWQACLITRVHKKEIVPYKVSGPVIKKKKGAKELLLVWGVMSFLRTSWKLRCVFFFFLCLQGDATFPIHPQSWIFFQASTCKLLLCLSPWTWQRKRGLLLWLCLTVLPSLIHQVFSAWFFSALPKCFGGYTNTFIRFWNISFHQPVELSLNPDLAFV